MTDLRTAAQQALEALELGCTDQDGNEVDLVWPAITALRAALAEPAAPTEYEVAPNGRRSAVLTAMMNARTRAEAALAEQPCSCGEPSAFGVVHLKNGPCYVLSKLETAAPTPYTEADCLAAEKKWSAPAAPTVVEPCAIVRSVGQGADGVHIKWLGGFPQIGDRLYATPPRAPTVVEPEPVAWLHEEGLKAITDDEKDGWIQSGRGSVVAGYSVPLYRRAAQ